MDLGIRGKVAIVAAASKGLGRAVALELAKEGVRIALCSRDVNRSEAAAAAIRESTGAEVLASAVDVSDPGQVRGLVQSTVQQLGGIHILITNAGGPPSGPHSQFQMEDYDRAYRGNFASVVALCSEVIPHMKKNRWGRIVNITSLTVKQPEDGLILSNSIRAAVVGYAKSLANELAADNILVNNVCPGYTWTERVDQLVGAVAERKGVSREEVVKGIVGRIPMGRMGSPEEFAAVVAFLVSERASYVTGATIPIDGGYVRSLL